ncbi:hypothetical protein BGZ92_008609 [Podila epicladia]|nr:hypothetical protein BGZ92_008609 [Podila epicladia]
MEEWLCYEECTPSDGWAANIALAMEDWPSMDCIEVMDNTSALFFQDLVHSSWMGLDSPMSVVMDEVVIEYITNICTTTNVAVRWDEEHPGGSAEDWHGKDPPLDATNPKGLSLKHTLKRTHRKRKHHTPKAKKNEGTSTGVCMMVHRDCTDPCSCFPTEVWLMVLKHLPLSVVARTSTVSTLWMEGARAFRGWKVAAYVGRMGKPSWLYKTFMSLVCSRSLFVCERCYGSSVSLKLASHIPLPVPVNSDKKDTWMLCHTCRCEYYQTHPERCRPPCNRQDIGTYQHDSMVTGIKAREKYGLSLRHLQGVKQRVRKSVTYYKENQVQARACAVHAGWVGVDAVIGNVQLERHLRFKMQLEAGRTQSPHEQQQGAMAVPALHADEDIYHCDLSANIAQDPLEISPMWADSLSDLGLDGENNDAQGHNSSFGAL